MNFLIKDTKNCLYFSFEYYFAYLKFIYVKNRKLKTVNESNENDRFYHET